MRALYASTTVLIRRAVRLDRLRVSTDLAGAAPMLPSWCVLHRRFDMSQADYVQRWCLGAVLADVSSDAAGSAVARVHVPPMTAVAVPVAP